MRFFSHLFSLFLFLLHGLALGLPTEFPNHGSTNSPQLREVSDQNTTPGIMEHPHTDMNAHDDHADWAALPGPSGEIEIQAANTPSSSSSAQPATQPDTQQHQSGSHTAMNPMNVNSIANGIIQLAYDTLTTPENFPTTGPGVPNRAAMMYYASLVANSNGIDQITLDQANIIIATQSGPFTLGNHTLVPPTDAANSDAFAQHAVYCVDFDSDSDDIDYGTVYALNPGSNLDQTGGSQSNTPHPLLGVASGSGSSSHDYATADSPQSSTPHPLLGVASGSGSSSQASSHQHNTTHPHVGTTSSSILNVQGSTSSYNNSSPFNTAYPLVSPAGFLYRRIYISPYEIAGDLPRFNVRRHIVSELYEASLIARGYTITRSRNCPEAGSVIRPPAAVARPSSIPGLSSTQANNNPHANLFQPHGGLPTSLLQQEARDRPQGPHEHRCLLPAPEDGSGPAMELPPEYVAANPGLLNIVEHTTRPRNSHSLADILRYDGPAHVTDVDIAEFFAGDENYNEAFNEFINSMPGEFAEDWKVEMWLKTWFKVDEGMGVGGLYQEQALLDTFCEQVNLTGKDLKDAKAIALAAWFRVRNFWRGEKILPWYVVRQIADDVQRARMINAVRRGVPNVLENHRRTQAALAAILSQIEDAEDAREARNNEEKEPDSEETGGSTEKLSDENGNDENGGEKKKKWKGK